MYYFADGQPSGEGRRVAMRVAEMPVSQPQPTPQPYPAPTPTQSAYQENFFDRFVTFLKDLFDVKTVSAAPLTVEAPVGEVYFLLGDHLGSTTMTLNLDGSVESEMRYDAWGKTRYTSGITPTERHYTGQIEESGFGLYFYNARWYDASLGRFLQADTIIPQPGSPQGWDRFVYIYNNPINGTDPTGHEPWWLSAISSIANSLCSIADPSRNPRTAAFNNAFWDGVEAWKDVGEMGAAMVDYTASAIYDGRVEDAVRGINGIIEGGSVLSQVPGEVVMQMGVGIVTTPVRIFSSDIPEFTSAITERFQGNDRTWDVLFTGANLSGDVIALYGLGKAGMEVENFARAGREIQLGNDFRLSPFGNRTGDPLGELPHYHRRGLDPSGNTIPGQGIGRHRPWETKSTDSSFWNRW